MELTNEEKCTYCREYGNLPCDECNKKLEEKKAMNKYMPFINIPNVEMKSSKSKPMNKTKYRKVEVSERLPQVEKWFHVIGEDGNVDLCPFRFNEFFATDTIGQREVKYWLEEIPDREEEMIEMLKLALNRLENTTEYEVVDFYKEDCEKIKSLLQSLKQAK